MESSTKFIAFILVLIVAAPSVVLADARLFIPKLTDYAGFIGVDSSYETNEDKTGGQGIKTKDLFLREKLELSTVGYVYHPRFILFLLKGSAGVKYESFTGGTLNEPSSTLFAREYEFRTIILPEHPYNLELFTLRLEPLSRRVFSSVSQSVAYSKGAIFRYKDKPYFLNVHYLDNTTESSTISYNTKRYGLLGTYFKERKGATFYTLSVSYDHQTSGSTNFSGSGSSDDAALGGTISFGFLNFASDLVYHSSDQSAGINSVSFSGKTISWSQRAHAFLPWNFAADLSYGLSKDTSTSSSASSPESSLSSTTNSASLSITHKLYNSLFSSFVTGYGSLKSDSGQSTTFSNTVSVTYVKNIPGGRLRSNISYGISTTDREGVRSFPNEPHSGIPVPGSFRLNNEDVNLSTLLVWLKSPDIPGVLILLAQNIDYVLTPFGNTFQIDILTLPPQFPIPATYDFVVSYSLNNENSKVRVTNLNYSISLELFGEMFIPYYNHSFSDETVLEGTTDTVPFQLTSDAVGFMFRRLPFSLLAEYGVVKSNINPSRGWKTELTYQTDLTRNTQLQASARYSSYNYPQGTGGNGGASYTDNLFGVSGGVQQKFPALNLYLSFGGSYNRDEAVARSTSYSLNSNLVWNVGKVSLASGANVSFVDSDSGTIKSKRTNEYYYLNVRRQLF